MEIIKSAAGDGLEPRSSSRATERPSPASRWRVNGGRFQDQSFAIFVVRREEQGRGRGRPLEGEGGGHFKLKLRAPPTLFILHSDFGT